MWLESYYILDSRLTTLFAIFPAHILDCSIQLSFMYIQNIATIFTTAYLWSLACASSTRLNLVLLNFPSLLNLQHAPCIPLYHNNKYSILPLLHSLLCASNSFFRVNYNRAALLLLQPHILGWHVHMHYKRFYTSVTCKSQC